jgi:hypothetical protein
MSFTFLSIFLKFAKKNGCFACGIEHLRYSGAVRIREADAAGAGAAPLSAGGIK